MLQVARDKQTDPTFGRRLRALREEKGWTQAELGEKAGMLHHAIARLERGERTPGWDTVLKLAEALGVTPNDFLGEPDEPEPEPPPPRRRTGKK
jgi:transcriptional regulator with XRE-family HTH domain